MCEPLMHGRVRPKPKSCLILFSPICLSSVRYAYRSLQPIFFDELLFCIRIETNHLEMLFFSEHILFRTSLPKCLYEIDACPTLLCLLLPSYRIYQLSFSHLCLGVPLILFPATIPCILVFSKSLCQVTWSKYLSF